MSSDLINSQILTRTQLYNHPRPSILIADDDPNLRMLLSYALEKEGYQTMEALDGVEVLHMAQNHNFDLILMDLVMPQLDGISCCAKMHESYSSPCPPILLMTALSDTESVDRAFQSGASDFVTKPIHWPILKERIKRTLELSSLRQEVMASRDQIQALSLQVATLSVELSDSKFIP